MAFWWRRRRKQWYGRYRTKRRRRWNTRRRRPYRRLRYRRRPATRRRRRRRRKVRRKKQKIQVYQWQPDSIVKCKIKGSACMVLGADGRQMYCYTDEKDKTVPPRTPMGGGFGIEVFSLKYLYEEYKFHNNIWTKTNIYKDLVRYLYCRFTFYRHQHIDFILTYDRQPPYVLNKLTYPSTHPHQLLQHKHKKMLLSLSTAPNGKLTKRFTIKPPKQMISKWFFQANFCKYPLLEFRAAACDLRYSYLGCCNENQQLGLYYLNQQYYQQANWGNSAGGPYKPWGTAPKTYKVTYIDGRTDNVTVDDSDYHKSISHDKGWFQSKLLRAFKLEANNTPQAHIPINTTLYNLNLDDGDGNIVYLTSILNQGYDPPTLDTTITIPGLPLWLALYGFFNYIIETKKTPEYLKTHCVMIKSKALIPYSQTGFQGAMLPIDKSFIEGNAAYDQPPVSTRKTLWFPTMEAQINTLNSIVEAGPYIPKFTLGEKKTTWELKYFYNFCFKWGGPMVTDAEVTNPCKQGTYDVPDTLLQRLQIKNPEKLKAESLIHQWDIRRGIIKETALKRMCDNLSIDTDFQAAPTEYQPPKKKRYLPKITAQEEENEEIIQCLRSLCEEDTCQETQTQTLEQLIQQQQQQQLKLKRNILELIYNIKQKQRMLELQTGIME
nr:MAG: ORF1 [Torque teno midi virus]